jgi:YidC/Oxa1 family membrane protein insertase
LTNKSYWRQAGLRLCALLAILAIGAAALSRTPDSNSTEGPFAKAAALEKAGKFDDALAEYSRIIKENGSTSLRVTTEARFRRAALLIKLKSPDEALAEYAQIVKENRGRDAERAAEALYLAGKYASSPDYPGTETKRSQALDQAYQLWRQLRDDYPGTEAARRIAGPNGPMAELMDRIDKRNSADWKYQVIDSFVRLTGKNPSYSYAVALILLAVVVKLILLPLTKKQYQSMREMQQMQPLVKELQKKYKGAELNQKTMELYKQHKVNPFAGCFTALVQIPFLILVFNAIREYEIAFAHGKFLWVGSPLADSCPSILGQPLIGKNLAAPDMVLLIIYVVTNYITMRMTPATDPQQQQQQNTMALMTSLLFFWMFLSYKWSSAFVLYWLALNILSIWQQYEMVFKPHKEAMASAAATAGADRVPALDPPAPAEPASPQVQVASSGTPVRVRPRRKKR